MKEGRKKGTTGGRMDRRTIEWMDWSNEWMNKNIWFNRDWSIYFCNACLTGRARPSGWKSGHGYSRRFPSEQRIRHVLWTAFSGKKLEYYFRKIFHKSPGFRYNVIRQIFSSNLFLEKWFRPDVKILIGKFERLFHSTWKVDRSRRRANGEQTVASKYALTASGVTHKSCLKFQDEGKKSTTCTKLSKMELVRMTKDNTVMSRFLPGNQTLNYSR